MTTFIATQTAEEIQYLLGEVYAEIPRELTELSPRDVNRLSAEWEERHTEGHLPRHPYRINFHD